MSKGQVTEDEVEGGQRLVPVGRPLDCILSTRRGPPHPDMTGKITPGLSMQNSLSLTLWGDRDKLARSPP